MSSLERKLMTGEIKSAQAQARWGSVLKHHLIPRFGNLRIDELRRTQIDAWREELGKRIRNENRSPNTANT